jgi:tripartite ATP-independent transporter DctP family solute receptor
MKRTTSLLLILLFTLASSTIAFSKTFTIKLSSQAPATDEAAEHLACLAMINYLDKHSDGRIEVKYYPGAQLGLEREVMESVQQGSVQMLFLAEGPLAGFFKPVYVFSSPYLFKDVSIAWKVLDGPFGGDFANAFLEKTGTRILAFGENGFRDFSNSVRPIESLADMKGLQIRVMESPIYQKLVASLGANPTPMPGGGELYSAMQQKVVDGQENPLDQIYSFRMYEVQKYVTTDHHTYGPLFLIINNEFYDSMPPDLQAVVKEAADVWKTVLRGIKYEKNRVASKLLQEKGIKLSHLTAEAREEFIVAAQGPVNEWIIEQIGPEWIDKILKATEAAENSFEKK